MLQFGSSHVLSSGEYRFNHGKCADMTENVDWDVKYQLKIRLVCLMQSVKRLISKLASLNFSSTLVNVKAPVTTTTWCRLNSALGLIKNGGKGNLNLYLFTLLCLYKLAFISYVMTTDTLTDVKHCSLWLSHKNGNLFNGLASKSDTQCQVIFSIVTA